MPTPTSIYPYDFNRRRPSDPPRLTLVVAPGAEVWSATDAEVTQALKLDASPADAAYVNLVLKAARRYFERITGLALINQTWMATFDRVPTRGESYPPYNEVELSKAPFTALTAVNYIDTNGSPGTANVADYATANVGSATAFGRARLKDTASFPDLGTDPGAFSFTFTCGFGADASFVPEEIKSALLFLAAHWYQNRLPVSDVRGGAMPFPLHVQDLIEACRVADLA